jgi:hypothetical protein
LVERQKRGERTGGFPEKGKSGKNREMKHSAEIFFGLLSTAFWKSTQREIRRYYKYSFFRSSMQNIRIFMQQ